MRMFRAWIDLVTSDDAGVVPVESYLAVVAARRWVEEIPAV
jgi:hypothetical protein